MSPIFRICPISKQEILKGDITTVQKLIASAESELLSTGKVFPWNMTISGYDTDQRSLNQIPEVKEWFFKVHSFYPHTPIYLTQFILTPYLYSLLDVEVIATQKRQNISRLEQEHIDEMVKLSEKVDPGSGAEIRKQLEYGSIYSVSENSVNMLFAGIKVAILMYLTEKGISKPAKDAITSEISERLKSSLMRLS